MSSILTPSSALEGFHSLPLPSQRFERQRVAQQRGVLNGNESKHLGKLTPLSRQPSLDALRPMGRISIFHLGEQVQNSVQAWLPKYLPQ